MLNTRRFTWGNTVVHAVIGVFLVTAATLLWFNRVYITDWASFVQYSPSAQVKAMTDRTTMSDWGEFYFYASHPSIESAANFNTVCTRRESTAAILGCYTNNRVYVYDVKDARLDGIKDVTAVHEMLHAAYQRLGDSEKKTINALLDKEYQKHKDDKDLAERMKYYDRYEAGERYNELHSIIATEYSGIGAELETYYAKYFINRQTVVDLHSKYAAVFANLKSQTAALSAQLTSLGASIEQASSDYNDAVKAMNETVKTFNARAESGDFASQAAFDRERASLAARIQALDGQRQRINTDSATYEKLRLQYNETAAESNELYKSMDSKLAPAPSL